MHRETLNTKYDADAQVKRLVRSMGKTFQKLSVDKKFFQNRILPPILALSKWKKCEWTKIAQQIGQINSEKTLDER